MSTHRPELPTPEPTPIQKYTTPRREALCRRTGCLYTERRNAKGHLERWPWSMRMHAKRMKYLSRRFGRI